MLEIFECEKVRKSALHVHFEDNIFENDWSCINSSL